MRKHTYPWHRRIFGIYSSVCITGVIACGSFVSLFSFCSHVLFCLDLDIDICDYIGLLVHTDISIPFGIYRYEDVYICSAKHIYWVNVANATFSIASDRK